jgi:hypothetical protein
LCVGHFSNHAFDRMWLTTRMFSNLAIDPPLLIWDRPPGRGHHGRGGSMSPSGCRQALSRNPSRRIEGGRPFSLPPRPERQQLQRVSDAGPLASYEPVPRAGVGKPARKEPAGSRWDLADYGDLTSERV